MYPSAPSGLSVASPRGGPGPEPAPPPVTCVGQQAVALVPCHVVDTRALVQTGVGCTLVDVGLAVGAWREERQVVVSIARCVARSHRGPSSSPRSEGGPCTEPRAWSQPPPVCTTGSRHCHGRETPVTPAGPGSGSAPGASGPRTAEAFPAGAHVAARHVLAGAAVDTGVGLALVVVDVTARPTPARLAVTFVPAEVTAPTLRGGPRRVGPDRGRSRLCHSFYSLMAGRHRSTGPLKRVTAPTCLT